MDPDEDIIDVLYKYRDILATHEFQQDTSYDRHIWLAQEPTNLSVKQRHQNESQEKIRTSKSAGYEGKNNDFKFINRSNKKLLPRQRSFDSNLSAPINVIRKEPIKPPRYNESSLSNSETESQRSIRKDIIKLDQEDPNILRRRKNLELVKLPNGAKIRTDRNIEGRSKLPKHRSHEWLNHSRHIYLEQNLSNSDYFTDYCNYKEEDEFKEALDKKSLKIFKTKACQTDDVEIIPISAVEKMDESNKEIPKSKIKDIINFLFNKLLGVILMLVLAFLWSNYLLQLHENSLWFTNIKEVEREISFRTEQGLYYSYFKQLVKEDSLIQGIENLKKDNITEHLRTINIFQRFNIHQELFMAFIYRCFIKPFISIQPIFFYTYFVFYLQGFFFCSIFAISWVLSGTWFSGILTAAFLICQRLDVTRVEFTVSLREHWSLPFLFAQFFLIGRYLSSKPFKNEKFMLGSIFLTTFIYVITWQFAQFAMLLQTIVLFALTLLKIIDANKTCKLLLVFFLSILSCWNLQYYQPMIMNSLVSSMIPIAYIMLQTISHTQKTGIFKNLCQCSLKIILLLTLTFILNYTIKTITGQEADNHIFRFVNSKLGIKDDETDFETRLYLCLPIFQALGWDFYQSMSGSGVFPIYVCTIALEIVFIILSVFKQWYRKTNDEDKEKDQSRMGKFFNYLEKNDSKLLTEMYDHPETCFHIAQSLILGLLAMSTLRMKCFWCPYICAIAASGVNHFRIWNFILNKLGVKNNKILVGFLQLLTTIFIITLLYNSHKDSIQSEYEYLGVFDDPDTVDLMEWIKSYTPRNAAFTGSMQLLAGVKLCTQRPLTNHPHFEDKELRARTKELYQIYSQNSPSTVHEILIKYNTSYIILEDSICMNPGRCDLLGILDLSNGHIPDDGIRNPSHLVRSQHPRFCNEIRYGKPSYSKYFQLKFKNRTFRVYKVLTKS